MSTAGGRMRTKEDLSIIGVALNTNGVSVLMDVEITQ